MEGGHRLMGDAGAVGDTTKQQPYESAAFTSAAMGIVSFMLPLLGIVTGLVGIFLGRQALRTCAPHGVKRGRRIAIAGITLSILAMAFWIFDIVIAILLMSRGGFWPQDR
jgi:hypothetical protein